MSSISKILKNKKFYVFCVVFGLVAFSSIAVVAAPELPYRFGINLEPADTRQEVAAGLQILFLLTILSLAPAILIMMTSFMRAIIILGFVKNALGTQQMPPSQVIVGLALFLTFFIMSPILTRINDNAIQPYVREEISQEEALEISTGYLKDFMIRNTREKDLGLFVTLSGENTENVNVSEIPLLTVVPAFMISELKTAFQFGFIVYIPFLVVDMVVASTLMSMGMMMLPPAMISLPFKILLFIMVDGWNLIVQSIVSSFK